MVGMKFLLVTTLFLMRYLSLFIYCATQRIYLKTSRTIGRLKTCKNWSLKTKKLKKQWLWNGLISFKLENDSVVKLTKLNYATLHLCEFEKQEVSLAMNAFSQNIAAPLELNDKKRHCSICQCLWNCLNIKTGDSWALLHDNIREPFSSIDDSRFEMMIWTAWII